MVLTESGAMSLKTCALKHFSQKEVHITRLYGYSVLILMLDGVLRFCESDTLIELKKGEYYIQRANCFQSGYLGKKPLRSAPGEQPVYYYLEFSGGVFSETGDGIPLRGTWNEDGLLSVLQGCADVSIRQPITNPFLFNSYLYRVLGMLYAGNADVCRKPSDLSAVRNYMDAYYMSLTLKEELSRQFGYTYGYLSKLFLREYGISIYRYLQKVRMERALWLLQNTDTPITEIPKIVGYANYTSFYRTFLAFYRSSPSEKSRNPSRKSSEHQ